MKKVKLNFFASVGFLFVFLFGAFLSFVASTGFSAFVKNTLFFSPPSEDFGKIKFVSQDGKEIFVVNQNRGWILPLDGECFVSNGVAEIVNTEFSVVVAPSDGVVQVDKNGIIDIFDGLNTVTKISGVEMFGVKTGDFVRQGNVLGLTNQNVFFSIEIDGKIFDVSKMFG